MYIVKYLWGVAYVLWVVRRAKRVIATYAIFSFDAGAKSEHEWRKQVKT